VGPVGPGYGAISGGRWLPQGLGGGEISTWWTPWGGAFIRTLRKGYNNEFNASTVDDPLAWRSWAMHAVSLMALETNTNGTLNTTTAPFTTSARIVDPDRHITFYRNPPPTSSLRRLVAPEGCGTDATATGVDGDPDFDASAVRVHVCGDIPVLVQRWAALAQPALVAPMPIGANLRKFSASADPFGASPDRAA